MVQFLRCLGDGRGQGERSHASLQLGRGPTDYKEMADRSAQLAIASPAPSVAEALLALALQYMTQPQYQPTVTAKPKSFAGVRGVAASFPPLAPNAILLIGARSPSQIGFDQKFRPTQAQTVDLKVFKHTLNIVAGLGKRNSLDPVDRVDFEVAGVAVLGNPLFNTATSGIIAGESKDVGAAIILDEVAEFGCSELHIIGLVV